MSETLPGRLPRSSWRDCVEPVRPAHGTHGPAGWPTRGERNARRLGGRLNGLAFAKVFTSPLQRAARTCELAGVRAVAERDPDLVEWNYGSYEGRTGGGHPRRARRTGSCSATGYPGRRNQPDAGGHARSGGESSAGGPGGCPAVLERACSASARCPLARARPGAGRYFLLGTASLSALGYEHNRFQPVIRLWDDTRHVGS